MNSSNPQKGFNKLNKIRQHLPAFLFFLSISLLLFLPWLIRSNDVIITIPGDSFAAVWDMWRYKFELASKIVSTDTGIIAAPFGFDFGPVKSIWNSLFYPFNMLLGEVFTYNYFIFISFPLAAFTMYLLAWHVTKNRIASIVAGFIFAFSPYHLMRSLQHLTLAHIQWLPLFFLSLIKLSEKRTLKNSIMLVITFIIVVLSDYYYGYFTILMAGPLFLFIFFYFRKDKKDQPVHRLDKNRTIVILLLSVCGLAVISAIYFIISKLHNIISLYGRSINELYIYSARPLEYLTPSIDNPFFGRFVEKFTNANLHGSNLFEQTLYLGFVPLILSAVALFKKSNDTRKRFIVNFAIFGAIIALIFSAPPFLHLFGVSIPMPSYFAYKIMPVFRVYARFGIFVMLFIALLAGIGFQQLYESRKSNWSRIALVGLTMFLITVEFINIPPWHYVSLSGNSVPKVYRWLAKQQGNFILAEYPWVSSAEYSNNEYLFYQRVHKKRLANGAAPGSDAELARQKLTDIEDSDIGVKLYKLGVKYVIIHQLKYEEGMIPNKIKRYYGGATAEINKIKYNNGNVPIVTASSLKLLKRFNNDYVYAVEAVKSGTVILWGNNFYSTEFIEGAKRRWMSNEGELIINNYNRKPIVANIDINAFSFYKSRTLEIRLGSEVLNRGHVNTKPNNLSLKHITLKAGINKLIFKTYPQAEKADLRIHNGDKRKLSISLSNVAIKEVSR